MHRTWQLRIVLFKKRALTGLMSDDIRLAIFDCLAVTRGHHLERGGATDPAAVTSLMPLLLHEVTSAKTSETTNLILEFHDRTTLTVLGEDKGFECYTVSGPGFEMIVV
jgi:hypothetical protein